MGPTAYLLTFRTYASHLPGDRGGTVDARHSAPGTAYAPPNLPLRVWIARRLPQPPFVLGTAARAVVEAAIRDECAHAGWTLLTLHVRTNHVHVVLAGAARPEHMMNQLKAWSTRRLREVGLIGAETRPWARHGSTRHLWTSHSVEAACQYVVLGQGAPLP